MTAALAPAGQTNRQGRSRLGRQVASRQDPAYVA